MLSPTQHEEVKLHKFSSFPSSCGRKNIHRTRNLDFSQHTRALQDFWKWESGPRRNKGPCFFTRSLQNLPDRMSKIKAPTEKHISCGKRVRLLVHEWTHPAINQNPRPHHPQHNAATVNQKQMLAQGRFEKQEKIEEMPHKS